MAILCSSPDPDTALVFVHGFDGRAVSTWERFPSFIRTEPKAHRADAIFWGYPSRQEDVEFCAQKLRKFLHGLFNDPLEAFLGPTLSRAGSRRPTTFRYSKVVLCAHSMGAVVVRRALIDFDEELDALIPRRRQVAAVRTRAQGRKTAPHVGGRKPT